MTEKERAEDQLIVEELNAVGIDVATVQDLMRAEAAYSAAIPVLISMLGKVETYALREIMARSLGTRSAKGKAERALIAEFERCLDDDSVDAKAFRWAIANTLELIGGKGDVDDLMRLLRDPRSANARGMLSLAAAKTKDKRLIPILLEYLESENLQGFAARGLGVLQAREAIPMLRVIAAETKNNWVRREATKALARIGAT
jgi:HEAT repeat protein